MVPQEKTNVLPISAVELQARISDKVSTYKRHALDSFYPHSSYFQWDYVKQKGNKITIDRSAPRSVGTGTIVAEVVENGDQTILNAKIYLDTGAGTFMSYVGIFFVLTIGGSWLYLDFNWLGLVALTASPFLILGIKKAQEETGIQKLRQYYQDMIRELVEG